MNNTNTIVSRWRHHFCAPLALCMANAMAADSIEEVIVSADFRDVHQMTVSGSFSVVDDTMIKALGASHFDQLLNSAANVGSSAGASHARFIQIRGVGDLEQFVDPKYFPSVGIVVDGVEMGGTANAGTLMDIKQVEILRGPQGTRFGTSALAGLVNIQSNDATDQFFASLNAGVGNYGFASWGGVVNGALTDTLFGRLAVQSNESDGYIDNIYLARDDTNNIDESSVRGKLYWQASDESQFDLTVFHYDGDNGYDAFSLNNNEKTISDQPGHDRQKTTAGSLKGQWQLAPEFTLETMLTADHSESSYSYDEDWTYVGYHDEAFSGYDRYKRDRDSASLDVRLLAGSDLFESGDSSWVLGVYAHQRDEDLHRIYWGDFYSRYDTDREAVYAEYQMAITGQLKVIAGGRYEHFTGEYQDSGNEQDRHSDNLLSAELTLEYLLDNGAMLYATVSQGQKPQGINTEAMSKFSGMSVGFQNFMQSKLEFDTETLLNYELGLKGYYFDDRLAVRAALFYMDRKDAQLESWMWDPEAFLWIGYLDSVDQVHSYGAELEIGFTINESWSWFANLGYLETEISEITAFDLDVYDFVTREDRDQAKSPSYQYSAGFVFEPTDRISSRVEWTGQDSSYFGYYHDGELDSYNLLNASVKYQLDTLSLQVWGRNLTDQEYATHGLYFGNDPAKGWINETYTQQGEPRVFGITVNYEFR